MCKQAGKQWVMGEFYDGGMHRPAGAEGFMGLCLPLPLGDRQTFGQPLASSARWVYKVGCLKSFVIATYLFPCHSSWDIAVRVQQSESGPPPPAMGESTLPVPRSGILSVGKFVSARTRHVSNVKYSVRGNMVPKKWQKRQTWADDTTQSKQ